MKHNYLEVNGGDVLNSLTEFGINEKGESVINTELCDRLHISIDPGDLGIEMGRATRGSITAIHKSLGRVALRFRAYRTGRRPQTEKEHICATPHGLIYRTATKMKVVLEFPLDQSFAEVADALDDEAYAMCEQLYKKARC